MAREEKRWKERVQRSACVRSAVWHYAWARKAGLKRANKKVVKASTGGGGCTYRGISYWRRRRGLLPRAACLSSLFRISDAFDQRDENIQSPAEE